MADSLRTRLGEVKAKGSSARFAADALKGEDTRNILSDEKRHAGRVFERAVNRAGLTSSQAAERICNGHTGGVSRVTSGLDIPPVIARWIADPDLRLGLIEALAELPGDGVHVKHVIECEAKASAR